jgi:hypothetical protein
MTTTLLMIAWSHWLPRVVFYGDLLLDLILNISVLRILYWKGGGKQLPWFFVYIIWETIRTVVAIAIWFGASRLYLPVSWCLEAIGMLLLLSAIQESLLRIFIYRLRVLLRWAVPLAICIAVLYSVWKWTETPAMPNNPFGAFVLEAEFAVRWGIMAVCAISIFLMKSLEEPPGSREDAVITGTIFPSLGWVCWSLLRSFVTGRWLIVAPYLPDMGYFIAAFTWIKIFARPVPKIGFKDIGMKPWEVRQRMRDFHVIVDYILELLDRLW